MPRLGRVPVLTRALFLAAAYLGSLQACCVTPPTAEELMDLGYRSPEQTFLTLRAAVRGDLPRLEYRSLSAGFRSRNGLSQLSYREFRGEWYAKNPWLKPALSQAEILERTDHPDGRHSVLRGGILGEEARIHLVAEDFAQLWDQSELREDLAVEDMGALLSSRDGSWVASVPGKGEAPTELRLGREWKIDGIERVETATP